MSGNVDNRVVQLGFDNKGFEQGVKTTTESLATLKKSLDLEASAKNLSNLQAAGKSFSLANIAENVQSLSNRFSTLGIIGMTAIQNLTNAAMAYGKKIADALISPMKQGLNEYETQINSVQTIMANTASKGTTLDQVNEALDELNTYSDKTIYNFTEMARNIGTFTAAGVELDTSVAAIKGIANLAAVSGSSSQQAATGMYQLSQAISSGTVRLMDWNSVQNAGMGGEVFKESLMETARVHGVAVDDMIAENGSFRDSLQEGWLSSEILLETLSKFTGDLNEEQLRSMGYTEEQIAGIIKMGQTAQDAATKVKTFTQLIDTLQEAMVSGWAQSWRIILGDFEEAKALFTEISDTLGPLIQSASDSRNAVLQVWSDLGGRTILIDSLRNTFQALLSVAKPIGEAFRDIFGSGLRGQDLLKFTKILRNFTEGLKISGETADKIKRIFKGFFSIFSIVGMAISSVVKAFIGLVSPLGAPAGGSILNFLANIGDYISGLKDFIKNSKIFEKTIQNIGLFLGGIVLGIQGLSIKIGEFLAPFKESGIFTSIQNQLQGFAESISNFFKTWKLAFTMYKGMGGEGNPIQFVFTAIKESIQSALKDNKILTEIDRIFDGLILRIKARYQGLVDSIGNILGSISSAKMPDFSKVGEFFSKIGEGISSALSKIDFSKFNFDKSLDVVNALLTGGFIISIMSFIKKGGGFLDSLSGMVKSTTGIVDSFKDIFNGVTGALQAMQQNLKANILLKIAGAIAILTVSLIALSLVDSDKLTKGIIALTTLFANLFGAMAIYEKTSGPGGFASAAKGVTAMLGLSVAVLLIAAAVKQLGDMDLEDLQHGIAALSIIIAELLIMMFIMSKSPSDLSKSATGIALVSFSLLAIVKSVKKLGDMEWEELIKGLAGITILFIELVLFVKAMNNAKLSPTTGIALILIAGAIVLLQQSVEKFGNMDKGVLIQGLLSVAALLGAIAVFLRVSGGAPMLITTAIALAILAGSLYLLSNVIQKMGQMPLEKLKQGLIAMGVALAIIAAAMNALPRDMVSKSIGLVGVGIALNIIYLALKNMGGMETEEIVKSLITLAGSMLILALGLNAMTGTLAGSAALLVAALALNVLTPVLLVLGSMSLQSIGLALLMLAGVFTVLGIAGYVLAPVVPVLFLLAGALTLLGLASIAFGFGVSVLAAGLAVLAVSGYAGALAFKAMVIVLLSLIPIVIAAIGNAIVQFAKIIISATPIIGAAITGIFKMMIGIILGIIPDLLSTLGTLLQALIELILDTVPDFIAAILTLIGELLSQLAAKIPEFVQAGFDILIGFLEGIRDNIGEVVTVVGEIVVEFLDAVATQLPSIIDAGANLMIEFINGMADAIEENQDDMLTALGNLGTAMVGAITSAINKAAGTVLKTLGDIIDAAIAAILKKLGINLDETLSLDLQSASLGTSVGRGIANGIGSAISIVETASKELGDATINGLGSVISTVSDLLNVDDTLTPTIAPVIDLGGVIAGQKEINSLFGSGFNISPNLSLASITGSNLIRPYDPTIQSTPIGTNISLVQHNHSPKALSRLEIYRQTRNQLLTLKGLV